MWIAIESLLSYGNHTFRELYLSHDAPIIIITKGPLTYYT